MNIAFANAYQAGVISKLTTKLLRSVLLGNGVVSSCRFRSYRRCLSCTSTNDDYRNHPSEKIQPNNLSNHVPQLKDESNGILRKAYLKESNLPNQVNSDGNDKDLGCNVESDSLSYEEDSNSQALIVDMSESSLISASEFHRLPPKCVSCGAIFQNIRADQPGFLPKEKLEEVNNDNNRLNYKLVRGKAPIICQPCHHLRHYNKMTIQPQHANGVLQQLHHLPKTRALILYVVDMFDMYGSIVPDISNIIGDKKHVILVGNKIDKFATGTYTTGGKQMKYLKESLIEAVDKFSSSKFRIVDTCLLSAGTGYGIEDLVIKIKKYRKLGSNVYIVGGNNSGKSTLFNMLQNLLNLPAKIRPLPPQAIVHHVPGSTYSLLRYPIGRQSLHYLRRQFLVVTDEAQEKEKQKQKEEPILGLADNLIVELGLKKNIPATEKPYLGYNSDSDVKERALVTKQVDLVDNSQEQKQSYLYDTPGIPNREQLLQFLTPEEIHLLKQKLWIVPETRIIHPGQVLLIGGIARIDYTEICRPSKDDIGVFEDVPKASHSIFLTSFFPKQLPIHITTGVERAEELYRRHLGGKLLKIPTGSTERLQEFPKLEPLEYTVIGSGWDHAAKDIVLNGLGWVSITAGYMSYVSLKVYTPQGIGQYIRDKPLMPEAIKRRGERGVSYLGHLNRQIYQSTRKKNPALTDHLDERNQSIKELMKMIKEKRKYDKLCVQHERQRERLEKGVVLGAFKRIGKLEKILEENRRKWLLEGGELSRDEVDNK